MRYLLPYFCLLVLMTGCNRDEELTEAVQCAPVIEFNSETGVYVVKVGGKLQLAPTYMYVDDTTTYAWILDGAVVGQKSTYVCSFDEAGSYYITIRVTNRYGIAEEEIRVVVGELALPVISLAIPSVGLYLLPGRAYVFAPDIQNSDEATFEWTLDGVVVGHEATYTFCQNTLGTYQLVLYAENEDGSDTREVAVHVVNELPIDIVIPAATYYSATNTKYVALGRTLYIEPYVTVDGDCTYQWSVDGTAVEGATELLFAFTPEVLGSYTLTLTVATATAESRVTRNITATGTATVSVDIAVECVEGAAKRSYTTGCSLNSNKVYAYVPAPGQFINETRLAGFNGEQTHEAAIAYAEGRLANTTYVSLGAWGGYIVVGFDHSIENTGGYDFSILGNQFAGSSEPGIVWVMQDTNGNGVPDEEWYELKGSEYGNSETIQQYACTYYRPAAGAATSWEDNQGNTGQVDYLEAYHWQDYYYPLWIEADSYTLYGTRLQSRTTYTNGIWYNGEFDWGYVDNYSTIDMEGDNESAAACKTYFKIANAVNRDGTDANLPFIDFIKVQTGLNVKAGILGENSTEVFGFVDER